MQKVVEVSTKLRNNLNFKPLRWRVKRWDGKKWVMKMAMGMSIKGEKKV